MDDTCAPAKRYLAWLTLLVPEYIFVRAMRGMAAAIRVSRCDEAEVMQRGLVGGGITK